MDIIIVGANGVRFEEVMDAGDADLVTNNSEFWQCLGDGELDVIIESAIAFKKMKEGGSKK